MYCFFTISLYERPRWVVRSSENINVPRNDWMRVTPYICVRFPPFPNVLVT